MAHRSDRREDRPITALATKAVQAIGPSRADSMMARSHTAPLTRPKIRLQSDYRAAAGGSYATKENLRRVKEKTFSTDLLIS